jgi:SAM-dependent methyltransferase
MSDSNTSITEQLDRLYTGNVIPIAETKKDFSHTYGEITRNGVETILNMFSPAFTEDAVFYDLGCGFGRMVAHIAIEKNIKKSCGIEFDPQRADWALKNFENFEYAGTRPEMIIGDMFKQDLSDATIVYFDNTVYPEKIFDFFKSLPTGCLFIYKSFGAATGDRFFKLETTYNKLDGRKKLSPLSEYWFTKASWRII